MKKQEKNKFLKRLAYRFDEYISKGIGHQGVLLFIFIMAVMFIFSILSVVFKATTGVGEGLWYCFNGVIDAGTVGGTDTENTSLVIIVIIVSLTGMIFTGMLISIINNALENRLSELRQGRRDIVEENHMVVIGCNSNTYTVVKEQIEANLNVVGAMKKVQNPLVVIVDDQDKEEMDSNIHARIEQFHNTRVICRSGKITHPASFSKIALEKANAIVVCCEEDTLTLQVLLALGKYLRQFEGKKPNIATQINDKKVFDAAQIALSDIGVNILYCNDLISRVTAQVCRQPGLSYVLQDLFNYKGNEIYIEAKDASGNQMEFDGCRFGDILNRFSNTTVIGVRRIDHTGTKQVMIDPPKDFIMKTGDEIVHIAEDDNQIVLSNEPEDKVGIELEKTFSTIDDPVINMLVIDYNDNFMNTMKNLDEFVAPGSKVKLVVTSSIEAINVENLKNITVSGEVIEDLDNADRLESMLSDELTNILILSNQDCDESKADVLTMIRLLHLRSIMEKKSEHGMDVSNLTVTSELHSPENQKLIDIARVNDFVVGSEFTNKVIAQIANQPDIEKVFKELLTAEGAEIYLRPAEEYIEINHEREISFAALTDICYKQRDIAIGWMKYDTSGLLQPVVNPQKTSTHKFVAGEEVIVISQGH